LSEALDARNEIIKKILEKTGLTLDELTSKVNSDKEPGLAALGLDEEEI